MDKVQSADKEIGDPNEQQEGIIKITASIPCQAENADSDRNADQFHETVKQQIIIGADDIKNDKKRKNKETPGAFRTIEKDK